jgi:hypothetical protein
MSLSWLYGDGLFANGINDVRRRTDVSSGNIVERLRAMAANIDGFTREKIEIELSEAADVIERLREELDHYLPPVVTDTAVPDSSAPAA